MGDDGFWYRHRHPDMSDRVIAQTVFSEWEEERIMNRMKGDQLEERFAPVPFAPLERERTEEEKVSDCAGFRPVWFTCEQTMCDVYDVCPKSRKVK